MAKRTEGTFEGMLEARLRWALESTITHFLGKPDRNAVEDWAETLAQEMGNERPMWQRRSPVDNHKAPQSPVDAQANHRAELPMT